MLAPSRFVFKRSFLEVWVSLTLFLTGLTTLYLSQLSTFTVVVTGAFVAVIYSLLRFNRPFEPSELIWNVESQSFQLTVCRNKVDMQTPRAIIRLPGLIILKLMPNDRSSPLWFPIWRDQLLKEDWRRLNVLAQWSALPNITV